MMNSERPSRPNGVTGPTGKPLIVENLPPPHAKRWMIRRKAEVVAAVHNGLIGLDEACERYRLSAEEFLNWEQLFAAQLLLDDLDQACVVLSGACVVLSGAHVGREPGLDRFLQVRDVAHGKFIPIRPSCVEK